MTIPSPSPELLHYLDITQKVVGDRFLPKSFRPLLDKLNSLEKLIEVEHDEEHPLWWFLPPILYDLFDEWSECAWLRQKDTSTKSIVVIPPPFTSIVGQLEQELVEIGLNVAKSTRPFSNRFVALLYGGYPWFEAYMRIFEARELGSGQCAILKVTSDTCDVPKTLESFKKKRRHSFGNPLQMAFEDLPFPGLVRPFHAPARIETMRHMRAADLGQE
jgi:hypothetical protein